MYVPSWYFFIIILHWLLVSGQQNETENIFCPKTEDTIKHKYVATD